MSDRVIFEVGDDAVGVVTLNRPDKLNAMDRALFDGLHDVAARARAAIEDGSVRAVLIRSEGRAFCAGLDVTMFTEQMSGGGSLQDDAIAYLQQALTGFEDLPVPVVAAVQGLALGGGCQLALAAHLRLATPDAELALLEAAWAIIPDLGAPTRLPRIIGVSRAIDMAVTARRVGAAEALQWGLVDRVIADADFDSAARIFTATLASGPTLALGAIPGLMRRSFTTDRDEMLAAERAYQPTCLGSDDFVEAAAATMQKRPPVFTGS